MAATSTTPTAAVPRELSTKVRVPVPAVPSPAQTVRLTSLPRIGEMLLLTVDQGVVRPFLVTAAGPIRIHERATPTPEDHAREEFRVSGTIFCEPDDHTRPALRGWSGGGTDPARITGHPDRLLPLAYGEHLAEGSGIGQWVARSERGPQ